MEVRFVPSAPPDAVFGILYQRLKPLFPELNKLPAASVPDEIRTRDSRLAYQPHYRLKNATFQLLLGPSVAAVVFSKPYLGWAQVRAKILETLGHIHVSQIVKSVDRLGLRYITFFEGDILNQLTLDIQIADKPVHNAQTHVKTLFTQAQCNSLLQVLNNAQMPAGSKRKGTVIDIDCSTQTQLTGKTGRFFGNSPHITEATIL